MLAVALRSFFGRRVIAGVVFAALTSLLYALLEPLPRYWIPERETVPDGCYSPDGRLLVTFAPLGPEENPWQRPVSHVRVRDAHSGRVRFDLGPVNSPQP